MTEER